MADDKTILQRLEFVTKTVDDLTTKQARLNGELDSHGTRLAELEKKCLEQYQCRIEELPAIREKLEQEAADAVADAESLLGIGTPAKPVQSLPAPLPKFAPSLPSRQGKVKPQLPAKTEPEDEDVP